PVTGEGFDATENNLSFSIQFDPTKLSISNVAGTGNPDVLAGAGLPANCSITGVNTSEVAAGRVGIIISCNAPATFAAGTSQLVRFRLRALAGATAGSFVPVTFTGSPIGAAVGDANANPLPTSF